MATLYNMEVQHAEGVAAAADVLANGGLVGLPTETVYGLAADASRADAVARIFAAKGRPKFNPLIVHVASIDDASALAELGSIGEKLANAFWPGPLTLVAAKAPDAPIADLVTAGLSTIAIRVPAHPIAHAVLVAMGKPLAAPSANPSGRLTATRASEIQQELGDQVDVILDAGAAPVGLESTIVAIGAKPTLLRPGAIPREAIERELGSALVTSSSNRPEAPGMLTSHYAPSVRLRLNAASPLDGEALLAFGPLPLNAKNAVAVVNLSETGDLVEAASKLFASLRSLDRIGAPVAVTPIPDNGLGHAINDRLSRAAAPRDR